jgi:magnesium transporter
MIDYNEDEFFQKEIQDFSECKERIRHGTKRIDFIGIDQVADLQEIGEVFELHPLTLEDIANIQHRPKIEDLDDYIFAVLKMLSFDPIKNKIKEEQISLVLGENYVISFQENESIDDFPNIKERITKAKGKIRKMKADYLFYSIVDTIIDQYFSVMEKLEERIELLQDELYHNPTDKTIAKVENLKKQLIVLRKSIRPVREMLSTLSKTESDLIHDELQTYLRDLHDHTIQIIDTIEILRDIIAGSLDIYLSTLSNKMNQIMKVLTIISTIFIPLTFIVGVYGMNFKYMPEFSMKRAYPILWIIMIGIAGGMLWYFKKKKWL